jgi:hypothetical protein
MGAVVLPLSRDYVNHVCILGKLAYSMLFHPIFLTVYLVQFSNDLDNLELLAISSNTWEL